MSEPSTPTVSPARPDHLITLSFADMQAGLCGQARLSLGPQHRGVQTMVVVFAHARTLAVVQADIPRPPEGQMRHGPLRLGEMPDGSWSADFEGGADGEGAFALQVSPVGLTLDVPAVDAVGAEPQTSEQQLARVRGQLTVAGRPEAVEGIGQVGRSRDAGAPIGATVTRELDAWLAQDLAICLRASRPSGAREHAGETVMAIMQEGSPAHLLALDETRLSTTYDAQGQQRRASLEIWPQADSDYPRRAAAQTICGASIRLDDNRAQAMRWDCAFMAWQMEGRVGVGPYSILRPVSAGAV